MSPDEVRQLVAEIRRHRSELPAVEVKSARGGTPQRALRESLSAFANRPGGGIILLGVDEDAGFKIVGVGDAQRLQEEISNVASNEMSPALRPDLTVADIGGKTVVAVEVTEIPTVDKPCYYRAAGLQAGSFIRVGPSNRRMTDYEIFGFVSSREQPKFDAEPIIDATLDDLNAQKLEAYLARLRQTRPRAPYLGRPFEQVLSQLGIAKDTDGILRPTLAGLLAFGVFPQAYEPQLIITFVHYFGTDEIERTPRGERFLDNRKFEGPVDQMIEDAINYVLSSIRRSSLIDGLFRRDIPEYPEEAIREAVINAVAHRDYSYFVRGSYVQIRLFADRLEIQSPGGLYGNVTEETIEEEQSTRNRVLVRFLEDLHLVENRGSGIRAMVGAMRRANLEPPKFEDRRASFWVTFRNHTLMGPDVVSWLNQFARQPLTDQQRLALAYLRHNDRLTNGDYRRLNHVDMGTATRELRGLVQGGLVSQHGSGRWTFYTAIIPSSFDKPSHDLPEDRVLAFLREHDSINNAECRTLLGISSRSARSLLTGMRNRGLLEALGSKRWTAYRLPRHPNDV